MDDTNVFGVFFHEVMHILAKFHQKGKSWTVVIFPINCAYLMVEGKRIIIDPRTVEHPIVVLVVLFQEFRNIINVVPVHLFHR